MDLTEHLNTSAQLPEGASIVADSFYLKHRGITVHLFGLDEGGYGVGAYVCERVRRAAPHVPIHTDAPTIEAAVAAAVSLADAHANLAEALDVVANLAATALAADGIADPEKQTAA